LPFNHHDAEAVAFFPRAGAVHYVVDLDAPVVFAHVAAAVAEPLVGALHVFRRVRVVAAQDDCQGG